MFVFMDLLIGVVNCCVFFGCGVYEISWVGWIVVLIIVIMLDIDYFK